MHEHTNDFRGTGGLRDGAAYAPEQAAGEGALTGAGDLPADAFTVEEQFGQEAGAYAEEEFRQEQDREESSGQDTGDATGASAHPYFTEVHQALLDAEATAHQSGRQVLAKAYEDLRIKAVANLDLMQAHAQLALAGLKWEPENFAAAAAYLAQAQRCLNEASNAVQARMQLDEIDARAQEARRADHASHR